MFYAADVVVWYEDIDVLQRKGVDNGESSLVDAGGHRWKPVFVTARSLERLSA